MEILSSYLVIVRVSAQTEMIDQLKPAVFSYHHHNAVHGVTVFKPQPTDQVRPIFDTPDTKASFQVGLWPVHNFPLGHGTFGIVNLATHTYNIQVACKSVVNNDSNRQKARAEIAILKAVHHPGILGYYRSTGREGSEFIHMFLELVTGGDLFSYVEKHGALIESEVQWFAWQLVSALGHLHLKGIVHRGELIIGHKTDAS